MPPDLLITGPAAAPVTLLLAHGAGAAMDSPGMTLIADAVAVAGLRVARFEFAYMAARRTGTRRPPPRAEMLTVEFQAAIEALAAGAPLVIGGKSMGGRVATLLAAADPTGLAGVLCLGYPFHPPAKPAQLRTQHLETLATPTLIVQGTRDPFGTADEVPGYALSPAIEVAWLEDGDHDLKPRKRRTGLTHADHMASMADTVAAWCARLS